MWDTHRDLVACFTWNQVSLLHLESSRARVSLYGLKTGGDVTVGGAHDTIVEVV
jgi:hypothetical protein